MAPRLASHRSHRERKGAAGAGELAGVEHCDGAVPACAARMGGGRHGRDDATTTPTPSCRGRSHRRRTHVLLAPPPSRMLRAGGRLTIVAQCLRLTSKGRDDDSPPPHATQSRRCCDILLHSRHHGGWDCIGGPGVRRRRLHGQRHPRPRRLPCLSRRHRRGDRSRLVSCPARAPT